MSLAAYQSAFLLRHAEFLRNGHPLLARYLGDTQFAGMARLYGCTHPSTHPNARWYSRNLPKFLAATLPFARKPEIAELAMLEGALNDAFEAADAGHLTMEDLTRADPGTFAAVAMNIHPSARLLQVRTNAASLWSSLKAGEKPPSPLNLDAAQDILVWRQSCASRFRLLGEEEAMAFMSAREGVPFGVICEMIAMRDDADTAGMRAASYLRGWIESELIAAFRRAEAATEK